MKRSLPWNDQVDVDIISDDSSSSDKDIEINSSIDPKNSTNNATVDGPAKQVNPEGVVIKRAEMYQEYMKQISIPTPRGSIIPFNTWMELAESIKQLYGQPLHYLTNILLKKWDQMRIGAEDEDMPLDSIIHPCKAEANIWLVEEVHRRTTSPHHVAKLWLRDPMHYTFVDSIFPQLYARA